jgi:hypothetical protein
VSGVVALVVVAAVVIVVVVGRDDGTAAVDPALTAPLAADQSGALTFDAPPAAYRIVYRAVDYTTDGVATTTTEELTVQRPFRSLHVVKDGAPPGGDVQTTAIHDLATFSQLSATTTTVPATTVPASTAATEGPDESTTTSSTVPAVPTPEVYQYTPQLANGDVRLDVTLPDLVQGGYFEQLERRTVLDRDCQVYRTGQAVENAGISKPSKVAYAQACIDRAGLVLEEVVVENGKVVRHITATAVDTSITPADDTFAITGEPEGIEQGALKVTALDPDAPPAPTYWVLGSVPAGFEHVGRYELLAAQLDQSGNATTNADGTTATTTGYADVYRSGPQAILVVQGPSSLQSLQISVDGPTVRIGGLGTGQVATDTTGSRLIAAPANPGDWIVRIDATETVEQVTALAKGMHSVEGPTPTTTTTVPDTTVPATTVPATTAPATTVPTATSSSAG